MSTSTSTILNPERVRTIFVECLFYGGDDLSKKIAVEGITVTEFNRERLERHQDEITALLGELPYQFRASSGLGDSFLNACKDKHGNLWTGYHKIMEMLFLLGLGIGRARLVFPRSIWNTLPSGMPFYILVGSEWPDQSATEAVLARTPQAPSATPDLRALVVTTFKPLRGNQVRCNQTKKVMPARQAESYDKRRQNQK